MKIDKGQAKVITVPGKADFSRRDYLDFTIEPAVIQSPGAIEVREEKEKDQD